MPWQFASEVLWPVTVKQVQGCCCNGAGGGCWTTGMVGDERGAGGGELDGTTSLAPTLPSRSSPILGGSRKPCAGGVVVGVDVCCRFAAARSAILAGPPPTAGEFSPPGSRSCLRSFRRKRHERVKGIKFVKGLSLGLEAMTLHGRHGIVKRGENSLPNGGLGFSTVNTLRAIFLSTDAWIAVSCSLSPLLN